MPGQSTLGGLLQSNSLRITAAQLLNLVNNPLVLVGAPASGFANLVRSLIVSLEFGTTPFVAPFGSAAALYYGGPARYPVSGMGFLNGPNWGVGNSQENGPSFGVTAVANASGGNTVYTANLRNAPTNLFAGLYGDTSEFVHGANTGRFLCVSNTQTTITLANASGVSDAGGQIIIEMPAAVWGACPVGSPNDLSALLTQSLVSSVFAYEIAGWSFPASEIAGAPIYLGNPLPLLGNPQNFTGGDSSLLITTESLQVQL